MEKLIIKLIDWLLNIYCYFKKPTNIILKFKDKDTPKYLIIETKYPIKGKIVKVQFSDMLKDWQLPLYGVHPSKNPQIKEINIKDFYKQFEIKELIVEDNHRYILDTLRIRLYYPYTIKKFNKIFI